MENVKPIAERKTIKEALLDIIHTAGESSSAAAKIAKAESELNDTETTLFYLTLRAHQMASCMTVFKEQLIVCIGQMEEYDVEMAQKMRGKFVERVCPHGSLIFCTPKMSVMTGKSPIAS
jgi:hypothetical protein